MTMALWPCSSISSAARCQRILGLDPRRIVHHRVRHLEQLQALERAVAADEIGDEAVLRVGEQAVRRVVLDQPAFAEDGDAVGHLHRLVDVVADEHDRLLELRLHLQELVLDDRPVDRVDGAEGLVHEQHRRVVGDGAKHADALLLAAGQLLRDSA